MGSSSNEQGQVVLAPSTVTEASPVQRQIHNLRLDLQRVQPDGVVGNLLCWWIWPVKFFGDPVFGAAEALVPLVASKVPLVEEAVSLGCTVARDGAHTAYGLLANKEAAFHLLSSSLDDEESSEQFKTLSYYLSLIELSEEAKQNILRKASESAGALQFLLGANDSMAASLLSHPTEVLTMLWDGYGSLYRYAEKEHLLEEAAAMGGIRYAENKAMLARIQQADLESMGKHRVDEMLMEDQDEVLKAVLKRFPLEEARRYVSFAVAAYGDNGIKSSQLDKHNLQFDWRLGDWTISRVSEHTGVPENDLRMMDVAYHNDPNQLRHFVAIDRSQRKIILAIRGTYTQKEVMIDFNGYSREFLGGESHAAISIMSERLWDKVGDDVVALLDQHVGYELIICGHSLGGGATCLLNLILHNDHRMKGRSWRAFAFASPPVYVPLDNVAVEARTCVNVINQFDGVPFLSGDTVRHQMAMIAAVDKSLSLSASPKNFVQKAKLLLGLDAPDAKLVRQVHDIQRRPLAVAKPGVPSGMGVPAVGNVWIWPEEDKSQDVAPYVAMIADSEKMSETGIFIHKNDFTDHLPARYEFVLNHMA